jgi:phosphatidylglycerol lysyltransferase
MKIWAASVALPFLTTAGRRLFAGSGSAESARSRPGTGLLCPDMHRACGIAAGSDRPSAHLAALGDKRFLFSPSASSFIMYRPYGRSWIALGDPVGRSGESRALIETFVARGLEARRRPVFYQTGETFRAHYESLGLSAVRVGQEARIDLAEFKMEGSRRARLRQTCRRAEKAGATFEVVHPPGARFLLSALRRVSDRWMEQKQTREKGFSLGRFRDDYVSRFPVAIVRRHGTVVAFATLWVGRAGTSVATDLTRYDDDAPYGVMEYLTVRIAQWAQESGYAHLSLGMAPLAGLDDGTRCGWERLGASAFARGERFYNFRGVRTYKSKFDPVWETRYLVSPSGTSRMLSLIDTGALIAGGADGLLGR